MDVMPKLFNAKAACPKLGDVSILQPPSRKSTRARKPVRYTDEEDTDLFRDPRKMPAKVKRTKFPDVNYDPSSGDEVVITEKLLDISMNNWQIGAKKTKELIDTSKGRRKEERNGNGIKSLIKAINQPRPSIMIKERKSTKKFSIKKKGREKSRSKKGRKIENGTKVDFGRWLCDICGYEDQRRLNMQAHIETHSRGHSNKCQLCSYSFKNVKALNNQSVRHGFELFYLNNIDGRCSR